MAVSRSPIRSEALRSAPHRVDEPWRHILAAIDARPESMAALNRALELARRDHAQLTILVAQPVEVPGLVADRPLPPAIDVIVERGRAAGLRVALEVRRGAAGQTIVDAAREFEADLIVVGRHGRTLDMPGGSATCGYVLTHSDRPVLVVQPWAPPEPMS